MHDITHHTVITSPVGSLLATRDAHGIRGLFFVDDTIRLASPDGSRDDADAFRELSEQLATYFAGQRTSFMLPLCLQGTPFQQSVWQALATIPHGATVSYGELAAHVGRPSASRAVAGAVGRNPVSIVVPCHRVIGADGTLTGYGGGLDRKRHLLELEGSNLAGPATG